MTGVQTCALPIFSTSDCLWALQSDAQETLLSLLPTGDGGSGGAAGGAGADAGIVSGSASGPVGKPLPSTVDWDTLNSLGFGFWIRSSETMCQYLDVVAKTHYQRDKQPLDAAAFYIMLGKTRMLPGLFRSAGDSRMGEFFANDFKTERWRTAALKNAYVLLSKQRYLHAVAFFLLGGDRPAAADVALRNLKDAQLALMVCRTAPIEDGEGTLHTFVRQTLLPFAVSEGDSCLEAIGHWWLREYTEAYDAIVGEVAPALDVARVESQLGEKQDGDEARTASLRQLLHDAPDAAIYELAQILCQHTQIKNYRDLKPSLFYRAAYAYAQTGMPLLALETLTELRQHLADTVKDADEEGAAGAGGDGGGAAAQQQTQQDMINTGTFDFGAFGDFDDFGGGFDEPAPAADPGTETGRSDAKETNANVADAASSRETAALFLALTHSWRITYCAQHMTAQLRYLSVNETDVAQAGARVAKETEAALQAAGLLDPSSRAVADLLCVLYGYTELHALPDGSALLLSQLSPEHRLGVQQGLAEQLYGTLLSQRTPAPGAEKRTLDLTLPRSQALCHGLTCALSHGLTQLLETSWELPAVASTASPLRMTGLVLEWALSIFVAQHELAWRRRDMERLIRFALLPLGGALWTHVFGRGVSNASDAALRLGKGKVAPPESARTDLIALLSQPIPELDHVDVHADDGAVEVGMAGRDTCTRDDEWRYRWRLLELLLVELLCLRIQQSASQAGIGPEELPRAAPFLYRLLCNLEHRVGILQPKVLAMTVPAVMSQPDSGGASYPASSLFKIRALLEDRSNPFRGPGARRLWRSVLANERVQDLVEYYIFHGPSHLAESRDLLQAAKKAAVEATAQQQATDGGGTSGGGAGGDVPASLSGAKGPGDATTGVAAAAAARAADTAAAARGLALTPAEPSPRRGGPLARRRAAAATAGGSGASQATEASNSSWRSVFESPHEIVSFGINSAWERTRLVVATAKGLYEVDAEASEKAMAQAMGEGAGEGAAGSGVETASSPGSLVRPPGGGGMGLSASAADFAARTAGVLGLGLGAGGSSGNASGSGLAASWGNGASFQLHRPTSGVRQVVSHPLLPVYATCGGDDGVQLWDFGVPEPARRCTLAAGAALGRTCGLAFDPLGSKVCCADESGAAYLWHASLMAMPHQYQMLRTNLKRLDALSFLAPSVIAFGGTSQDGHNVEVIDLLLPPSQAVVRRFTLDDAGVRSMLYLPHKQLVGWALGWGWGGVGSTMILRLFCCVFWFDF